MFDNISVPGAVAIAILVVLVLIFTTRSMNGTFRWKPTPHTEWNAPRRSTT